MKTLKQRHDDHIAKLKASGVTLTSFNCPACNTVILTRVPDSGVYDTVTLCPECEEIFFKIVHADGRVVIK